MRCSRRRPCSSSHSTAAGSPSRCPGPLELPLLLGAPVLEPLEAPFTPPDRLEPLAVALEIEILLHQDHLHLAEQPHDVIGKFHVVAVLRDDRRTAADRPLRRDFVELGVGISLELRPAALVEEEPAPLAHGCSDCSPSPAGRTSRSSRSSRRGSGRFRRGRRDRRRGGPRTARTGAAAYRSRRPRRGGGERRRLWAGSPSRRRPCRSCRPTRRRRRSP